MLLVCFLSLVADEVFNWTEWQQNEMLVNIVKASETGV